MLPSMLAVVVLKVLYFLSRETTVALTPVRVRPEESHVHIEKGAGNEFAQQHF